jgi:peroxiredoxin
MGLCIGGKIPNVRIQVVTYGATKDCGTIELFAGKRVVLFALPGAYTPTCSASHVPGYVEQANAIVAAGAADIYCLSVNDAFVMTAWAKNQSAIPAIKFLADGNCEFSEAMGMAVELTELGFARRSKRYSMVVDDGVITAMFEEEHPLAGDPFEVSDAKTMLTHLEASAPPRP